MDYFSRHVRQISLHFLYSKHPLIPNRRLGKIYFAAEKKCIGILITSSAAKASKCVGRLY